MTDQLTLREAYWDDPPARNAFKDFMVEIFGLDLSRWEDCGYWDELFRPFSYFDADGRVAASVCIYSMDLQVEGRRCRAAQISSVATRAALRRRGLNRELTELALAWARPEHDFVFLFSDVEAIPFYEACGFQSAPESRPFAPIPPGETAAGMRRLDMDFAEDRELAWRLASQRAPVSDRLGVLTPRLFMFHALRKMAGHLYHLPALDVLVCFVREGEQVFLHDVVGTRVPRFEELRPYLTGPGTTEAVFYFMPDKLALPSVSWRPFTENEVFDRGDIPLRGEPYLFPLSAHA